MPEYDKNICVQIFLFELFRKRKMSFDCIEIGVDSVDYFPLFCIHSIRIFKLITGEHRI